MGTLLRFLTGNRDAILRLAGTRTTLGAGLLFVLAAGLARDYDAVDLMREPWWLLLPPAASVAVSLLLFGLIYDSIRRSAQTRGDTTPRFWPAYRAFLGLFWMTAPMALLYAIPYERLLGPADATLANLWTLGFVALWRMLLITRVLSVLTGRRALPLLFVVLGVGDVVLLAALTFLPSPIIDLMGGIQLTERERILQSTTITAWVWSVLSLPVWVIGSAVALFWGRMDWNVSPAPTAPPPRGLVWCGAATVVAIALILPGPQRERQLQAAVEQDLAEGRVAVAVGTMSAHNRREFPPLWDPPPRLALRGESALLLDVLDVIAERGAADWVRAIYIGKMKQTYLHHRGWFRLRSDESGAAEWARAEQLLDRLPEGPALRREHEESIAEVRQYLVDGDTYGSATRPATTLPATLPDLERAQGPQ